MPFKLKAPFKPAGGQSEAIEKLSSGYAKHPRQTLLGITGSGKTFVMANVIQNVQKPTLILAHNKTLAAQLYQELKSYFPENRVEYFISYFDYYQPESYLPTTDTYIEKDSSVNEQIEKMRLKAVASLLSRDDVIVVASISCIYGIGNPEDFKEISIQLVKGQKTTRDALLQKLIEMQYERGIDLNAGTFRLRGDVIDVLPAYDDHAIRIELFGDSIDRISEIDRITGEVIAPMDTVELFAAKQFVVPLEKQQKALVSISNELDEHLPSLPDLERHRLEKRVKYDLEMIKEMGYCTGIENYSRHFDGRNPGEPPFILLDYFPKDFLLIIDESHQSIPQSRGMYAGDYSRKKNLVDFGFRLPSAFDNRPLKFHEFERYFRHAIFVSATPAEYERQNSEQIVELIVRPTGLIDPVVEVRPSTSQIKDLLSEIKKTVSAGDRVLITTLTKKMAEDLTEFLSSNEIRVRYLHSDIDSLDRIEIISSLRAGDFDVLVGINLLREGLDLPEVSLVAILDADKEGFLRNETSLIQTIGRAARNVHGRVIMYADKYTKSIEAAVKITQYRRKYQEEFNRKHKITPKTVKKAILEKTREIKGFKHMSKKDLHDTLVNLEAEMRRAAENLNFEKAIEIRDTIAKMRIE